MRHGVNNWLISRSSSTSQAPTSGPTTLIRTPYLLTNGSATAPRSIPLLYALSLLIRMMGHHPCILQFPHLWNANGPAPTATALAAVNAANAPVAATIGPSARTILLPLTSQTPMMTPFPLQASVLTTLGKFAIPANVSWLTHGSMDALALPPTSNIPCIRQGGINIQRTDG